MFTMPDATIASKYVIKTHYIMRVLEFHPENQTVDLIQDVFEFTNTPFGKHMVRNEFGNTVTVAFKKPDILYGVPVKQLRWGQFEIQACPVEGDTGYIEVFTNDIQDWIVNGSRSIPWSDAHFVKKNCVFVPFIPNHKNASEDYPADNTQLVIRSKNASITITDDGETSSVTIGAKTMEINAEEGINITGNVSVAGAITAEENITSKKDVIVETAEGTGVTLKTHMHPTAAPGAPSTPTPGPITQEEGA